MSLSYFFYFIVQVRFITQCIYIIHSARLLIQLFVGKYLRKKERGKERIRVHENVAMFMHCMKNCMTMLFAKSNVRWLISVHTKQKT